jgi:hypothetical protein
VAKIDLRVCAPLFGGVGRTKEFGPILSGEAIDKLEEVIGAEPIIANGEGALFRNCNPLL